MDAVLMAGDKGERLRSRVEKPLFEIRNRPIVDYVVEALRDSGFEEVYAAVTHDTPDTSDHLSGTEVTVRETPGKGYVEDLREVLEETGTPVLTVSADLPLLNGPAVDFVLERHPGMSTQVCVPTALKRRLGFSLDTAYRSSKGRVVPSGINVVTESRKETMYLSYNVRYAANVNRPKDIEATEALLP
ncbi:MAG: NTP transferase domain-containing protein [Halobacteria archaeon]